jgi:hypothetical protein
LAGVRAQAWSILPPNGGSGGIGANIWGTSMNLAPVSASINGVACTVVSS